VDQVSHGRWIQRDEEARQRCHRYISILKGVGIAKEQDKDEWRTADASLVITIHAMSYRTYTTFKFSECPQHERVSSFGDFEGRPEASRHRIRDGLAPVVVGCSLMKGNNEQHVVHSTTTGLHAEMSGSTQCGSLNVTEDISEIQYCRRIAGVRTEVFETPLKKKKPPSEQGHDSIWNIGCSGICVFLPLNYHPFTQKNQAQSQRHRSAIGHY